MNAPNAKALFREAVTGLLGTGGDVGSMAQALPALRQFVSEFGSPDFVCVMAGIPPTPPTTHPGVEGLAEGWSDYASAFENVGVELEDVLETDDHIVVLVKQVAVTRHQAVEISQRSAMVCAFENGQVKRLEFHLDHDAALRAAGLEPGREGRPATR